MANEVTFASVEGELGHDYLIMAEDIIASRYAWDNVRDCLLTRDIAALKTDAARFPLYPSVSAGALTDGTDLTANTAFTPTQSTLTVAEAGLKFTLTDLGASGAYIDDGRLASEGGRAVLEKINTDITALGAGFSQNVGVSGADLTEANFQDAIITLIGNKSPENLFAVLHQRQWYDLVNSIGSQISAAGTTGRDPRTELNDLGRTPGGMGGDIYGVDVRVSPLVPTANAGADRQGFMAVKNRTLGMVLKWFVRPEFERDASLRGTEAVVTACYAVGEIEDLTGVSITTDA